MKEKGFNIEVYKIITNQSQNNFVLVDKTNNRSYVETNLVNMYSICMDLNIDFMFKLLFEGFVESLDNFKLDKKDKKQIGRDISDEQMIKFVDEIKQAKIDKVKKEIEQLQTKDIIEKKVYLIENQKQVFSSFRKYVLVMCKNIHGITYKPVESRIIEKGTDLYFNLYRRKKSFNGLKPDPKAKFPLVEKLLRNLLQEGYDHFIKTLAWKLQHPEIIIPNHWIIQDDGGTGKTQILGYYVLRKMFNINQVSQDELQSGFNDYLVNCDFLICEEIEGFSNEKKIKMLTGSQNIVINRKFQQPFTIGAYYTIIIFSNDLKPLKISRGDRRFNVVGGGQRLSPTSNGDWKQTLFESKDENIEFFKEFHKKIDDEIKSMYKYLISLELDRVELQLTLNTKHKQELERINYSSEQDFFEELTELGLESFVHTYIRKGFAFFWDNNIVYKESGENQGYWIKTSGLYELYKTYTRETNLKTLGKTHFFKRLHTIPEFNDFFRENKIISHNNDKLRCLRFKIKNDTQE